MSEEKQKLYNPVVDILRIISILAVIIIHTTTRTLETSAFALTKIPWTLFLNQAARFAVPLFFMISGFVLELNYHLHESYLTYLKKRFSRIMVPYIFWSVIYYFFIYPKGHDPNFLNALLQGDASYQLYFIPALLIFYLLFPLIHNFCEFFINKWLLILFGAIELLLLYYNYNVHPLPIYYPVGIALLNFYVFLLGIVLARNQERFRNFIQKWKLLLFFATIIFAIYIFFEGLNGYLKTHDYLTFYSSWRPSILLYTICLSGFLYWVFNRRLKAIETIKKISHLSFFVFFIHVIILEVVWYIVGLRLVQITNGQIIYQVWFDPLYFTAVTIVSFAIAFLAHKIPYLNKLTG
ncbi:MAG TPA: acyltransferase [Patescibacteria group bacterium]|nr:acyltransferase [Patescibacteria group bacterium]